MVSSYGQMVGSIRVNGSMGSNMDKETIIIHKENRRQVYGRMGRETHGSNRTIHYDIINMLFIMDQCLSSDILRYLISTSSVFW